MVNRKRKANFSASRKKVTKTTKKEEEYTDLIPFSLPVLSDEKVLCEEYLSKIRQTAKVEEKVPRVVLPKIKITCEPLNVEKIIDLENPGNVHEIKKPKNLKERETKKTVLEKPATCDKMVNLKLNNVSLKSTQSKAFKDLKKRKIKEKLNTKDTEIDTVKNSKSENRNRKKIKIFINGSDVTYEKKSFLYNSRYVQQTGIEQQSFQAGVSDNFKKQSGSDLNCEMLNNHEFPGCSLSNIDDESAFLELKDVDLEDLAPCLEEICNEELKMKIDENDIIKHAPDLNFLNIIVSSDMNQCNLNQANNNLSKVKKNFMQAAVEAFMNNPQLKYLKENTALKKGLCSAWLSNNYECSNENCQYNHNALNLFTRKLSHYQSKFILTVVVSMRNDDLFVDVVMAAFKIITERKMPVIWLTFLIYFVFYVTEPSDSRFLKFWANSARFFNRFSENYSAANGFASLLSIFSQVEKSDEWKIIEFIKIIKQPPVQVPTNYALLLPILNFELPPEFLVEAVESCINTQKDVLKVYSVIIPKISLMTSPISVIEVLLKFCKILEGLSYKMQADNLKRRLQAKVLSFKSKITQGEYPLTASFQEELCYSLSEENFNAVTSNSVEQSTADVEFLSLDTENNYFQQEDDFWNSLTSAMALPSDAAPSMCKTDESIEEFSKNNNFNDKDISDRQLSRIRQFFQNYQFDLLGKYLNELKENVIEKAAKEFLKLSFQLKISLRQAVDLVKIILLPCKSENAAKVIASISITLILNLVSINEWKKAYTIVFLCQEKKINLVEGKVFYFKENCIITQCRIVLLLIEIYSFKNEYRKALDLVKEHFLFSSNHSLWKLSWKPDDKTARVRIMEDLLHQVIYKQLTSMAFELFDLILKEQKKLAKPVDLRKFVNEILILLLNQDSEDAINLFEKVKAEVQLNDITSRAVLVTLVRRNRLSAAKSILFSVKQDCYVVPKISLDSITVTISRFWLEEEIYVMFDTIFDMLATECLNLNSFDFTNLEIGVQITAPKKVPCSALRPLCLGIIRTSFKDACARIRRVLQHQLSPPLKFIIMPYGAKLEAHSVKLHIHKRIKRSS